MKQQDTTTTMASLNDDDNDDSHNSQKQDIHQYLDTLMGRVKSADTHSDCEDLRRMLKDVTDEILHLNSVVGEIYTVLFTDKILL